MTRTAAVGLCVASVTCLGLCTRFSAGATGAPTKARPAYETETWPQAPLLVWDVKSDKGGWLENGQPSSRKPDKDTDVLLPASDKPYLVGMGGAVRHLTIEKNAYVRGGSHAGPMWIWGNVHVKDGGQLHFCNIKGPKHTFFRIDGAEFPKPGGSRIYHFTPSWGQHGSGANLSNMPKLCRTDITHKFQVCKYEGGSVEFIGNIGVNDEVQVQYGTMIIGPDSEFRYAGAANKAPFEVFDGATLELQSGAAVAPFQSENSMNIFNVSVYKGGTLRAGSPERPITKDAHVLLGYSAKPPDSGASGMYCGAGSTVNVHSADPAKARLVFSSITSRKDFCDGKGRPLAEAQKKAEGNAGIVMHFGGAAEFDGVMFDYVRSGGIRLLDQAQKNAWKNVSYGPDNAADGPALIAKMTRDPNYYYHDRKYMRYYLVQKSLSSMEKETGEKAEVVKKESNPHKTK